MASNYALVSCSAPVQVGETSSEDDVRHEITEIYQSYAELYPNPNLAEEYAERDRLMEAHYHATHAEQIDASTRRGNKRRSPFAFLWRSKQVEEPVVEKKDEAPKEDEILVYSEDVGEDCAPQVEMALCGSTSMVESSCIPPEAHASARFHLVSRITRGNRPNAIRGSNGLVVIGLGEIAEVPLDDTNDPLIRHTSDREDLLAYRSSLIGKSSYDPSYVRGTCISQNCVAVSWGFPDGVVCIYRRINKSEKSNAAFQVAWECVGMISPSQLVLDNMPDLFALQDGGGLAMSSLLCIADMVLLLVDAPSGSETIATLAIARLGGFMELVPLPGNMWNGPVLTTKNHRSPRRKRKRPQEHYCVGSVPNVLESAANIAAITTSDHHVDIMGLEIFRTSVRGDTEWDEQAFPDAPPSEYVLAACGRHERPGEVVTFWGLTTVFQNPDIPSQFSLHVAFLDGIQLDAEGADMTIFTNDAILRHWRRARHVELRSAGETSGATNQQKSRANESNRSETLLGGPSISTLTVASPIARMRFSRPSDPYQQDPVLLAILDANGAVSALNCSEVVRLAVQAISKGQYEAMYESEDQGAAPIRLILERSIMGMSALEKSHCEHIADIGWLGDSRGPGSAHTLLVVKELGRLLTLSFDRDGENKVLGTLEQELSHLGVSVLDLDSDGRLGLAMYQRQPTLKQTLFRFLALGALDLRVIVESLMQVGSFQRAISLVDAVDMGKDSRFQSLIEKCHQRLWERDGSVQSLRSVSDATYTSRELLRIYTREADSTHVLGVDSLESVLELTKATLVRLESVRLASALQVGGLDGVEDMKALLRSNYLQLSTFLLLCRLYDIVPTLVSFQEQFLSIPLEKLASSFASMGDVPAVTLLLCRSYGEFTSSWLKILSHIPLAIHPSTFCHLIPAWRASASESKYFCVPEGEEVCFLQWSQLGVFFEDEYGQSPYMDDFDENLVGKKSTEAHWPSDDERRMSVADWARIRAFRIDQATGSPSLVASFCDYVLKCLNFPLESSSGQKIPDKVRELNSLCVVASSLDLALLDGGTHLSSTYASSSLLQVSINDLLCMKRIDVISLLLGPPGESTKMFSKFESFVKPLLDSLDHFCTPNQETSVDEFVVEYCLGLVSGSPKLARHTREGSNAVEAVRNALSFCAAVAKASRLSIASPRRLIRDISLLVAFALQVISQCGRTCEFLSLLPSDCRFIVDVLWEIYECVPVRSPRDELPVQASLFNQVDSLYRSLVGVDILSSWSIADSISILNDLISANQPSSDMQSLATMSKLCRAFCVEVSVSPKAAAAADTSRLVGAFLSDVEQLRDVTFNKTLNLSSALEFDLIKPLLQKGKFDVVGEISEKIRGTLFERQRIQAIVQAFANECMFSEGESSTSSKSRVHSAIQCQDILLPLFPGLQVEFSSMRRYLDAAHFVNSVLNRAEDRVGVHPGEIRDMPPIDTIEQVLASNPFCVLEGCVDWRDPPFASNANRAIHTHYRSLENPGAEMASRQGEGLPTLPGSAVLHLARMLGQSDELSQLVVKARIVHYALRSCVFGAAAAVCLTMLYETDSLLDVEDTSVLILNTVSEVLSMEAYEDILTKMNLCLGVFSYSKRLVSEIADEALESVLLSFPVLESQISCLHASASTDNREVLFGRSAESDNVRQASSQSRPQADFFVFRAAGMVARRVSALPGASKVEPPVHIVDSPLAVDPAVQVYRSILTDYSTDIHVLFSILQAKSASADLDDPLLLALGRLIMFWCISDAVGGRQGSLHNSRERSVSRDFVGLAASLLLQMIDTKELRSTADEMKEIVVQQMSAGMERTSEEPSLLFPDPEIVRGLVGRGYSENGARRSAIMSGNESYEAALAWAVSHTLQPGFDDPMVFLASQDGSALGPRSLDQTVIKTVQDTLESMRKSSEGAVALGTLLPCRQVQSPEHTQLRKKVLTPNGALVRAGASAERKRAALIPASRVPQAPSGAVSKPRDPPPSASVRHPTIFAVTKRLDVATAGSGAITRSMRSLPQTGSTPRSAPSPARSDRSALRQQGEAARDMSKSASAIVDKEERKRLIEEGRRLLEQSRANKQGDATTPTPRYPLRSRVQASSVLKTRPVPPKTDARDGKEGQVDAIEDDDSDGWNFDDF